MRFHNLSIAGIVLTAVCIQLDSDMCFTQEKGDIWTFVCGWCKAISAISEAIRVLEEVLKHG